MTDATFERWGVGKQSDRLGEMEFERAMDALRAELANAGAHMTIDGTLRAEYDKLVSRMSRELRREVNLGHISWRQAAEEAVGARNHILESIRSKNTPVGKAIAESLKSKGLTLNELIARKTIQLFGPDADFNRLTPKQKNEVFAAIVESAGKSRPKLTARMRTVSRAGKGLLVLSVAISVYVVATAENKGEALAQETAATAAGIGGGIAGGAIAGLACGPGAPVCVTVGAFVGGALAAIGVDLFF